MRPLPGDQIWGMVCGLPEPRRSQRHLFMLKAFIDDSGIGTHPIYALGGWIGPASTWAGFSDAWDAVLRMGPRVEYFKLSEALGFNGEFQGISEPMRDEKLKLLVDTIEEHELIGLCCIIPQHVFNPLFRPTARPINSPYFHSCYSLMGAVYNFFHASGYTHKINFVYDEQIMEIGQVLPAWQEFVKLAPEHLRGLIGDSPTFTNDIDTVALQAADLQVGWARLLAESKMRGESEPRMPWGNHGDNIIRLDHVWTPDWGERLFEQFRLSTDAGHEPVFEDLVGFSQRLTAKLGGELSNVGETHVAATVSVQRPQNAASIGGRVEKIDGLQRGREIGCGEHDHSLTVLALDAKRLMARAYCVKRVL